MTTAFCVIHEGTFTVLPGETCYMTATGPCCPDCADWCDGNVLGVAGTATDLRDGDRFTFDAGATWHTAAVNMAAMGTVSCYVSGRKSTRGMTYRVPVDADTAVIVRTRQDASSV